MEEIEKSEEIKEVLGEGFHTAFRKAVNSKKAYAIWKLIRELSDEEWNDIIDFVYECIKDYMVK